MTKACPKVKSNKDNTAHHARAQMWAVRVSVQIQRLNAYVSDRRSPPRILYAQYRCAVENPLPQHIHHTHSHCINMSEKQQQLVLSIIDYLNQSIADGTVKQDDKEGLEVAGKYTYLFLIISV